MSRYPPPRVPATAKTVRKAQYIHQKNRELRVQRADTALDLKGTTYCMGNLKEKNGAEVLHALIKLRK